MPVPSKPPTIGVFDSGFGGLTVLRELLPRIPGAHFVYLGDTARLPYGSKSQATIARYAVESARFLEDHAADHLVIACNTASALALPEITSAVSIPVTGVIAPAVAFTNQQHPAAEVLILATAATVHSHAYRTQCEALGLHATEKACPLLVPLVEEGWIDHPVTRDVLRIYLTEALATCNPQAVILGCTHYPLLASQIQQTLRSLGSNAQVIDSALATAQAVQQALDSTSPTRQPILPAPPTTPDTSTTPAREGEGGFSPLSPSTQQEGALAPDKPSADNPLTFYATDSIEKFARLGTRFLGRPIHGVHLLDLGG